MTATSTPRRGGNGQSGPATWAAAVEPEPASVAAPWRLVDLPALGAIAERQPAGWLVEGVLPAAGLVTLVGPALVGKSTTAAGLAGAVAGDALWCGRDTMGGAVVWVAADRPTVRDTHELLSAAARGAGLEPEREPIPLVVLDGEHWSLDDAAAVAWLAAELDRLDARLLVLDSLRRLTALDECRSDHVAELARQLATLTGGGRRCVVLIHHASHEGRPRGSTDLVAMSDSLLSVSRKGKSDVLRLVAQHHRCAPVTIALRLVREGGVLVAEPAESDDDDEPREGTVRSDELRRRVVDALEAMGGEAKSTRDLAAELRKLGCGVSHDRLGKWLRAAADGAEAPFVLVPGPRRSLAIRLVEVGAP